MGTIFGGSLLAGNALLGLFAAAFWGVGDFSGGMGVKHAGGSMAAALRIVLLSHITSFGFVILIVFLRGDALPPAHFFAWGIAGGVAGGLALTAFYTALARGAMGAAAAVSGLLAAAIPALVAMASEGAPGWRRGVGFLVAGAAIWMIAAGPPDDRPEASTMGLAIAAGAGFGFYFVALKFAGGAGPVWPMAMARMGSIATCALILLALSATRNADRTGAVRIKAKVLAWVLNTALFDTAGNLLFIAATRAGGLDVAAVLASLYPASTILLAAWMLKERPTKRQGWGMLAAAGAVVLIAG